MSTVVFAVFVTLTCGPGGTLADPLHGAGVLPGVQTPLIGFAVAVFVICAGGLALIVAFTV